MALSRIQMPHCRLQGQIFYPSFFFIFGITDLIHHIQRIGLPLVTFLVRILIRKLISKEMSL